MERRLRRLSPDVVVLAGCGLIDPRVLAIAREGVVSVHPALLPWVRGNGGMENSILRGVPLGCTTFRVDAGIDTGTILERRLLPVAGDAPPAALRAGLPQTERMGIPRQRASRISESRLDAPRFAGAAARP